MKKHITIYTNYFNIGIDDKPVCEIPNCNNSLNQVHHINPRGMGGSKTKDYIENLIGCCMEHHIDAENGKLSKEYLSEIHLKNLKS